MTINHENQSSFDRLSIQVVHILFGSDDYLLQFFFHHKEARLRLPVIEMIQEAKSLSPNDFLLVQTAIDLWSGEAGVSLIDLMTTFDDHVFLRVLQALAYKT